MLKPQTTIDIQWESVKSVEKYCPQRQTCSDCMENHQLPQITGLDKMLNGHAYSRAVRAHIWTNLILAGIILDEVDLTGKERAETENKLRESERSLILFVKENRTYQSLRAKFKTALRNLEVHEWEQVGVSLFRAVGRAAEELVVSRERLSKPFTPGFLRKINNDIGKMEEFVIACQQSRLSMRCAKAANTEHLGRRIVRHQKCKRLLPEAEKYTGHSFRRSSATILVDITALKRHGGWKSTTVAEGYIDTSMNNKMDSANKIINAVQCSSGLSTQEENETTNFLDVPFQMGLIWKVAQIIMILKPGKKPEHVSSYRPISLLPMLSKVLEKLYVKKLNIIIAERKIIPNHQFGFRNEHGTIEQVHRLVNQINKDLNAKRYCSAAFLDISQAFDKINDCQLPQVEDAKYLGMHLDRRLTWKKHIFSKRKQLGLKLSHMYWLIGRKSKLSLDNKVLLYKSILKPVWTYGIQLWGTACVSNINILQRFQNKVLRAIVDAPYYVSNEVIQHDIPLESIKEAKRGKDFFKGRNLRRAMDVCVCLPGADGRVVEGRINTLSATTARSARSSHSQVGTTPLVTDGFKRPRRQEVPLWDESLAADKNHSPLSACPTSSPEQDPYEGGFSVERTYLRAPRSVVLAASRGTASTNSKPTIFFSGLISARSRPAIRPINQTLPEAGLRDSGEGSSPQGSGGSSCRITDLPLESPGYEDATSSRHEGTKALKLRLTVPECEPPGKFEIKDLGDASFCLGVEFGRVDGRVTLHQRGYNNDMLARFDISECKPVATPVEPGTKLIKQGRQSNDTTTRPDISFGVSHLGQFNNCYGEEHWTAAKRVLRYLKRTADLGLVYEPDSEPLPGFELGADEMIGSVVFCGNKGSLRLAENPTFHARNKHIDIRHHFVRDVLRTKKVTLKHDEALVVCIKDCHVACETFNSTGVLEL
ncbi:hypothetical protein GEV33_008872 [Tenebrio molitor]|uniref:Reverse transcriptase domain-containing protein n=1 Tax=Tenebrio molitor TaxID=7067 RepID=A0A8J6HFW7_TENMO|nr:hypothetical protein GEV33_008872 [Tenebrio molitor]